MLGQKGAAAACGCPCTGPVSADPMARLCAHFRMALAIALAAAAAQACAVQAVCVGGFQRAGPRTRATSTSGSTVDKRGEGWGLRAPWAFDAMGFI